MSTTNGSAVRAAITRIGGPLAAVVAIVPEGPEVAGPLSGTAVAVKDMIDVEGFARGNGNPEDMAGAPATADAAAVRALRAAGADVVALAALLEYAAGAQHPDLPEARNPVVPSRTAGGSSGGSAALVGAGLVPAALGSDTGGSIRLPAHYCGIVGFKPTFGALSLDGVQPLAPTLDHLGVLAVDVATTARVVAALGGAPAASAPVGVVRLGLLVGQVSDPSTTDEVAAVILAAVARLAEHERVEVVEVDAAPLQALNAVIGDIILFEAAQVHAEVLRDRPEHFGDATRRLLLSALEVDRAAYTAALDARARLIPAALALLDGVDALVGPAAPYVAPAVSPPIDTPDGEIEGLFSGPANVSGQPAIVLPAGRTPEGLPVGLQLLGLPGEDAALLAVAAEVERILGVETVTGPVSG